MGLAPWSLHGSPTFEVLDLAGNHFAGCKEIVPCRPENIFLFLLGVGEGGDRVDTEQQDIAG